MMIRTLDPTVDTYLTSSGCLRWGSAFSLRLDSLGILRFRGVHGRRWRKRPNLLSSIGSVVKDYVVTTLPEVRP